LKINVIFLNDEGHGVGELFTIPFIPALRTQRCPYGYSDRDPNGNTDCDIVHRDTERYTHPNTDRDPNADHTARLSFACLVV
jgi:hypothetical protein